jgi:hypothetical protein
MYCVKWMIGCENFLGKRARRPIDQINDVFGFIRVIAVIASKRRSTGCSVPDTRAVVEEDDLQ